MASGDIVGAEGGIGGRSGEEGQIGRVLQEGEFLSLRLTPYSSNDTFEATLALNGGLPLRAIYKPAWGEAPLWDFPPGTLYKREYAAYLLSEALGWRFVPLTVIREGPHGPGSVQLYIEHDPRVHYFTLRENYPLDFQQIAVYDILANNADRKSTHCLCDPQGRIWCIDHGVTFHSVFKLRTVIWDCAGEPIPPSILEDLVALEAQLREESAVARDLGALLAQAEMAALGRRLLGLLDYPVFPHMELHRRSYPWPLV